LAEFNSIIYTVIVEIWVELIISILQLANAINNTKIIEWQNKYIKLMKDTCIIYGIIY